MFVTSAKLSDVDFVTLHVKHVKNRHANAYSKLLMYVDLTE